MSAPGWTEVRVLTPAGWQELVAEALAEPTWSTGVAFGRPTLGSAEVPEGFELVRTFLPSRLDGEQAREDVLERLRNLAAAVGAPELEHLEVEFKALPPEDYATSWKKSWKPFRVGRLCLLPPWHERTLAPHELRLTIQPGGSFGSGRHATTRTCLRVLQERLTPGERILDAGCGSGILSVAAALLGASHTLGFDVDPNSETAATDLAEENDCTPTCRFRTGGFETLTPEDTAFDAVLANIYSDVIQQHATDLQARLRPGGWFTFSGCPTHHVKETQKAIQQAGLHLQETRPRGRWHTFVGIRP